MKQTVLDERATRQPTINQWVKEGIDKMPSDDDKVCMKCDKAVPVIIDPGLSLAGVNFPLCVTCFSKILDILNEWLNVEPFIEMAQEYLDKEGKDA